MSAGWPSTAGTCRGSRCRGQHTESNIPAIKAMVDLDRRIRESILEKKYDKIKEQTIKQEEAENINADSIRKDMNREFID